MPIDPVATRRFIEAISNHLEDHLALWKSSLADARRDVETVLTTAGEKIPAQARSLFPENIIELLLEDALPPPPPPERIVERVVEKVIERVEVEVPVPSGTLDWSVVRASLSAVDSARTQVDVLSRFLVEANAHASRVALLVLRNDRLTGWKGIGWDATGGRDEALKSLDVPAQEDPVANEVLRRERSVLADPADESTPLRRALGGNAPARSFLVPIVIRDRIAGILVADELPGDDGRLSEAALETLTFVTGLAVDLLAARKKIPSPTLTPTGEAVLRWSPPVPEPAPVPEVVPVPEPFFAPPEPPSQLQLEPPPPPPPPPPPAPPSFPQVEDMASTIAAVGLAPALHRPVAPQPPPPAPAPSPERAAPEQVTPHPSYRPAPQVESYAPPAADPHEETDPSGKARNRGTSPADAMRAIEESTGRPAPRPVPPPPPDFHGQAPAPAPLPPPRPAAPPAASPAPEPSGFVASPSVQPPPGFVPRSVALRTPDPQRQIDDARRFARLLVNEIKLYNERKVQEGKAAGTLYETLKDDIERSRQAYAERVPESIRATTDFFHEELVRILADGRPEALGPAGS